MTDTDSFLLRFRIDDGSWQERRMEKGAYTVGRAPDCALMIGERSLSRRHARLILLPDSIHIMDLGSANGTQIDGVPLPPRVSAPVRPGQTIFLGRISLRVMKPETADSSVPPAGAEQKPEGKSPHPRPKDSLPAAGFQDLLPPPMVRDAASGVAAVIRCRVGDGEWTEKTFHQPAVLVGRGTRVDLPIDHPAVSRKHALLENSETGLWITDLESANGIVLEGRRLPPGVKSALAAGQELAIGPCRIQVFPSKEEAEKNPIAVSPAMTALGPGPGALPPTRICADEENSATGGIILRQLDLSKRDRAFIGRSADNNLVLDHPMVSRYHALIERMGGRFRLTDLGSANGVFVNDARAEKKIWLREHDRLRIGPYAFLLAGSALQAQTESGLLLEAKGLHKRVGGKADLLQNIDLTVQPQEFVALVGMSGAGKTTLLDALSGFRPATNGRVTVNGVDLYGQFDMFRNEIGYVPQKDIVHPELTPRLALDYAAQLRMPPDTTATERRALVAEVLKDLGLSERRSIPIARLSGGEVKRVSIGVELLTKPRLFFLDEPTSGLDPGTEYEMMKLLRRLADQGRTVLLVTHATKNVMLCDKVVFLARGGHLAFFGPPEEALSYFDAYRTDRERHEKEMEFDDIYRILGDEKRCRPADWAERHRKRIVQPDAPPPAAAARPRNPEGRIARRRGISPLRQFLVLSKRNLRILFQDRISLLLMLLLAPGLGLLDFVWGSGSFDPAHGDAIRTMSIWFMMSIVAMLIGSLSSVREIVKEADIYKRERTVGVKIIPYILSKVWVGAVLSAYQGGMLLLFRLLLVRPPLPGSGALAEVFLTVFLGTLCGYLMGLCISAVAPNQNASMLLLIAAVVPQFLFAGVLLPLDFIPGGDTVSKIIPTRWTFEAFVNATGTGKKIAADACWSLDRETRLALSESDKADCVCLGKNLFTLCSDFPGIVSADFYDDAARQALASDGPAKPPDPGPATSLSEYAAAMERYGDDRAAWERDRQKAISSAESLLTRVVDNYGQAFYGTVQERWLALGGIMAGFLVLAFIFQKRKDAL